MEDLKIILHRGSCQRDRVNENEYVKILNNELKDYNPSINFEIHPIDDHFDQGFSYMSCVNPDVEENEKITLIIRKIYNSLMVK